MTIENVVKTYQINTTKENLLVNFQQFVQIDIIQF